MSTEAQTDLNQPKPAGTLAGWHGVRERFWRHSKRYQVEIRDHVCKTKVHITIDRGEKTDEEQAREAALLRDAVARINYEETGKKKALNFPNEDLPTEIMARARMELDKARAKASEARTRPKVQHSLMKMCAATMTLDPANTPSTALATLRQSPQATHGAASEEDTARTTAQARGGHSSSTSTWGCKRQRTASVRRRAGAPWHEAAASLNSVRPRAGANPSADHPPMNPGAKMQAFLSGMGPQLPNQSAAPLALHSQPLPDPFAWQLQFAQMQAAHMHAAAQAAQFQGMYAGLLSGSSGQAQTLPCQAQWGGGAMSWGAPGPLPWAAQAQVAAAAQAAAAANPTAATTLAQQAASWAAAQVAATMPAGANGMPVTSLPSADPAALNPLQQPVQYPSSHPNKFTAAQGAPTSMPLAPEHDVPEPLTLQQPSLLQMGLESATAAASAELKHSCAEILHESRFTLLDIADAAAAASAAEQSKALVDASTGPVTAAAVRKSDAAEPLSSKPVVASCDHEQGSLTPDASACACPQPRCSSGAAAAVSCGNNDAAAVDAEAVAASTDVAEPVGSDSKEAGGLHSERVRSADGASTHEVSQVGHKRSRGQRVSGGSYTEEDSSDEATIAIIGSDIHSILPGAGQSNRDGEKEEQWRPRKKVMAHETEPDSAS